MATQKIVPINQGTTVYVAIDAPGSSGETVLVNVSAEQLLFLKQLEDAFNRENGYHQPTITITEKPNGN